MHQFLNKKILDVYNLTSTKNIIVYEDGTIQKGETTAERKLSHLHLPFISGKATKVIATKLAQRQMMLIF